MTRKPKSEALKGIYCGACRNNKRKPNCRPLMKNAAGRMWCPDCDAVFMEGAE